MGFKNRKKSDSQSSFKPLDLNEENVQQLFKKCLTIGTPQAGIDISSNPFDSFFGGYGENEYPEVSFNTKILNENKQTIQYLFGQLKKVHENKGKISPEDALQKYSNINWTSNSGLLMELLYLGRASGIISYFVKKNDNTAHLIQIKPTLSPRDPSFIDWYDSYLAEMRKSEGPTPDEK